MPVSSTFSTSAPKSASSSEQNPPGSSRDRSSTRIPSSGSRLIGPLPSSAPHRRPAGRPYRPSPLPSRDADLALGDRQHRPCLADGRRPAPHVLGHLPCLGDQIAVGAGHAAVRQVEVVL